MIWAVAAILGYVAWLLAGIGAITCVDDDAHRLWTWVECKNEPYWWSVVILTLWPVVVWKWLHDK